MKHTLAVAMGLLLVCPISGCDEAESRPFEAGDGRTMTLLSLEAETKEVANGRIVGFLIATFEHPRDMGSKERRPLAEKLCPLILADMGTPEEINGAPLETVLIKYRETDFEVLGITWGHSSNYWVEMSRGECISRG